LDNVSGEALYWKDLECGYSEVTTHREIYDYLTKRIVPQEMKVLRFRKPRTPLPAYQQPEYLRIGISDKISRKGQIELVTDAERMA
jgi:hypothetical protein